MLFLDWQFTAQDDEHLDPARYQYREALIMVDAMYRDVPACWKDRRFMTNGTYTVELTDISHWE